MKSKNTEIKNDSGNFFEKRENFKAFYSEKIQAARDDLSEIKSIGGMIDRDSRLDEDDREFLVARINDVVDWIISGKEVSPA